MADDRGSPANSPTITSSGKRLSGLLRAWRVDKEQRTSQLVERLRSRLHQRFQLGRWKSNTPHRPFFGRFTTKTKVEHLASAAPVLSPSKVKAAQHPFTFAKGRYQVSSAAGVRTAVTEERQVLSDVPARVLTHSLRRCWVARYHVCGLPQGLRFPILLIVASGSTLCWRKSLFL